jgi:hypothetical protein
MFESSKIASARSDSEHWEKAEKSRDGEQRRGRERSRGEESGEAEGEVGAVNCGDAERGAGARRAARPREE